MYYYFERRIRDGEACAFRPIDFHDSNHAFTHYARSGGLDDAATAGFSLVFKYILYFK